MMIIDINTNEKVFEKDSDGAISVKISGKENNGLSLNDSGQIKVSKGKDGKPGTGGTPNYPGNGIAGTPGQPIPTLQFNNTVSRIKKGDPDSGNEGVFMPDIVDKILKS